VSFDANIIIVSIIIQPRHAAKRFSVKSA